jgi:hypothetical protein
MTSHYEHRLRERIENAVATGKIKARPGSVKRAKELYLKASQGFVISPGFNFDLAIGCLREAGFEIEQESK